MASGAHLKPTFSLLRRWGIAFNVVLGLAAALALVVMVNYLSARHHWRFQLTREARLELSPETLRVLRGLTNEVRIKVFFNTSRERELYDLVAALLKEYNNANPRILIQTIDPTRQPAEAQVVRETYKLSSLREHNFIIVACEGRTHVIYQNELADVKINFGDAGQPFEARRVAFKGEELFTTAIFNLVNPRHFKIGFTQGHREHDPNASLSYEFGYSKFAQALKEKTSGEWVPVSLLGTNDIPSDCQLLIIAGPQDPFSQDELEKIDNFLRQGKRLFALLANPARAGRSGLERVLQKWNVKVGDKPILDLQQGASGTGMDLLTKGMDPEHPVTKALLSDSEDLRRLYLVLPREVKPLNGGTAAPDAPRVARLAWTSESGEEALRMEGQVPLHDPNPVHQEFTVVVAVEQGDIKGVSAERGATRIIVVGDSHCLDNELFDQPCGNHYFATLAVNWLLDRPDILLQGLVPQPLKTYRLLMTQQQFQDSEWLLLAGLPGMVLFIGALVWWRRRH